MFEGWPGEKLCIQVWQSIDKLGTGLLGPLQARRMGKALADVRRQDALIDAQTKRDVESILSGKASLDANGKLIGAPDRSVPTRVEPIPPALSYDPEKTNRLVQNREQAKATLRYLNLRGTVRFVEEELVEQAKLQGEEKVPEEPPKVDQDWLFRWASAAEQVSNEDMQRLWARVLAGESQKPGSYSVRTLEALRSLTKAEAELITRVAAFALNRAYIYRSEKFLEKRDLPFGSLLALEEIGVLTGVQGLGVTMTIPLTPQSDGSDPARIIPYWDHRAVVVRHSDADIKLQFEIYPLTIVGRELIQLGSYAADMEYLSVFGEYLRTKGFKVWAANLVEVAGGQYTVSDMADIQEQKQ